MESASKAPKRRRQGHISVACQACKNRRSKCSGGPPPCSLCTKLDTECHFDPDADMRRRASREGTKTYKALFDAFINSLRRDDVLLSQSLHEVITAADPSGRLREVAEEYAERARPGWLLLLQSQASQLDGIARYDDTVAGLNLDLPTIEDLDEYLGVPSYPFSAASSSVHHNLPGVSALIPQFQPYSQMSQEGMASYSVASASQIPYHQAVNNRSPAGSKEDTVQESNVSQEDLKAYLQEQLDNRQLTIQDLPILSCDLFVSVLDSNDPVSRSILNFRDNARRAASTGISIERILDSSKPDLTLMFRDRKETDPHTAWSWACDFGKSFDNFSFPLRLAYVYMAGIQMRFFIHPCAETFSDLPEMLRPLQKQYRVAHPAGIDICHIPALKSIYLDQWDRYEGLLSSGQSCNWPYSDGACLAYERERDRVTTSRAFYEHIGTLSNYSIGKCMLDFAPSLRGRVRITGE